MFCIPYSVSAYSVDIKGLIDIKGQIGVSGVSLESKAGRKVYGEFILIPHTAADLLEMPHDRAVAELSKGLHVARERGARIVVSPEVLADYTFRWEFFRVDTQTRPAPSISASRTSGSRWAQCTSTCSTAKTFTQSCSPGSSAASEADSRVA